MWKILLTLFAISYISAQTIYVDNNVNNNADFHTIEEAIDTSKAGDTIIIKAGTYHERIYIEKSGTKLHPIIIKNYANDKVIIDGSGVQWEGDGGGLFHIDECSYISISGFEIRHSIQAGVFLNNTHHITIQDIKTNDTYSSGMGVWDSNHIVLTGNDISLACNDGAEECISISNSHHVNVINNEVHHNGAGTNGGEGIDVKQGSHHVYVKYNYVHHIHGSDRPALYADAWDADTYHILFESNRVHDIEGNGLSVASEMGGHLKDVTFVNNIVYNIQDGGLIVGGWRADKKLLPTPVSDIKIINNTFYNVGSEGIYIHNKYAKNIKIYNNIIINENKDEYPIALKDGVDNAEVDIRKNLIDRVYEGYEQSSDIVAKALFVDAINGNFHLQSNSSAINAGIQHNSSLFDYDKNSRTTDGQWDIGAYENEPNFAFLIPIWYLLL